jgi:hypothetical protein
MHHCFITAFETYFAPVQEHNALLRMEPSDAGRTMSIARDRAKTWCSRGTRARQSDDLRCFACWFLVGCKCCFTNVYDCKFWARDRTTRCGRYARDREKPALEDCSAPGGLYTRGPIFDALLTAFSLLANNLLLVCKKTVLCFKRDHRMWKAQGASLEMVPMHGALLGLPHGLCSCFIVAFQTWSVHVPEHTMSLRKRPSHVESIRKVAQFRCTCSTSYPAPGDQGAEHDDTT